MEKIKCQTKKCRRGGDLKVNGQSKFSKYCNYCLFYGHIILKHSLEPT